MTAEDSHEPYPIVSVLSHRYRAFYVFTTPNVVMIHFCARHPGGYWPSTKYRPQSPSSMSLIWHSADMSTQLWLPHADYIHHCLVLL